MTINNVTRTLYGRGLKVTEQLVEECLQQDLFGRVRQANGRWAVKTAAPSPATKPARQTTGPVNGNEGNGGIANGGGGRASIHGSSFLPEQSGRDGIDEQEPKEEERIGASGNGKAPSSEGAPEKTKQPKSELSTAPVEAKDGNGTPAEDALKERIARTLASAPAALSSTELLEHVSEETVDITRKKVARCLYQLREEGRALVDRHFKWHAAQGERPTPRRREKSATEPISEKAPASLAVFMPSSLAGHVTADLESAKRLALVLGLSSRPLSAADLSQVMGEMGWSIPPEKAESLLAGPLQQYARCEEGRWRLHPIAPLESQGAADAEPSEEATGGDKHALTAQTQSDGMAYQFGAADLDAPAFFAAKMKGAATVEIQLNTGHPAYELLRGVETVSTQEAEAQTPRQLLWQSQRALRLLLVGWARYEEDLDGPRRRCAQKARSDWGRRVRRVMQRGGGPSWEGPPAT